MSYHLHVQFLSNLEKINKFKNVRLLLRDELK